MGDGEGDGVGDWRIRKEDRKEHNDKSDSCYNLYHMAVDKMRLVVKQKHRTTVLDEKNAQQP